MTDNGQKQTFMLIITLFKQPKVKESYHSRTWGIKNSFMSCYLNSETELLSASLYIITSSRKNDKEKNNEKIFVLHGIKIIPKFKNRYKCSNIHFSILFLF